MAALLKADFILADESKEATILLDCYDLPDGQETPSITIIVNDSTRAEYRDAYHRYVMPKAVSKPGQRGVEIIPKDENVAFVLAMFRAALLKTENWIDKPEMKVIDVYLTRTPAVSRYIANALAELFEAEEGLKREAEDEDKKNSQRV